MPFVPLGCRLRFDLYEQLPTLRGLCCPQAGPQAPCPLESQSVTTGIRRPCPMVEALPRAHGGAEGPMPWASGTGRGACLPYTGHQGEFCSRD